MSWKGTLIKAGMLSDGKNITVEGTLIANNLIATRGESYYVHSEIGVDNPARGKIPTKPLRTITFAVGKCVANRGDIIYALPGHIETITAAAGLVLSIAGMTVVFLGEGENKATITFTVDADADMDIDADDITFIGPRFISDVDALTGPIDINAADFKIIDGEWYDRAGKATTDCIVATAAAVRLIIKGWKFFESTGGTQKQSNIQLNGVDDAILKGIDIRGDFATGNIENVGDEMFNVRLRDVTLDNLNATPKPCIVVDANTTGHAKKVKCRVASGTTYISSVGKINWASDCEGFSADGEAGEPLGTTVSGGVESKIGDFSGDGGAAQDDSVKASLDLAHTDLDTIITNSGTIITDTDAISGAALPANPVANSLAAFLASGGTALGAELADSKSIVNALGFNGSVFVAGGLGMYLPRCVEKSDGAVLNGLDDLFTITGGPVRAKIIGVVTTIIGGASNGRLQITTVAPAATADLNTGAVAIDDDAVGTSYQNVGATSVFTPVTAGAVIIDPVTVEDCEFLLPIGTVKFLCSAAQTGVIKWYLTYWPLSPNSVVVAAA